MQEMPLELNEKMRPVGLEVDRCGKAVEPSCENRLCLIFGTNGYIRYSSQVSFFCDLRYTLQPHLAWTLYW